MNELDIGKLKAFRGLKPYVERRSYDELLSKLTSVEIAKLEQLEFGLEAEDEFQLLAELMGKCSSIQKVDETRLKSTKASIPADFIATFRKELAAPIEDLESSITMFVEVKRCRNKTWRISKQDFDKRLRFAALNHLPLCYAVKFEVFGQSVWSLFPSDFVRACNNRLHFTQCWNSIFDLVLGGFNMFVKEAVVMRTFTTDLDEEAILRSNEFGSLSELTVNFEGKTLVFSGNDPVTLFFSCLQVDHVERKVEGTRMTLIEHVPRQLVASYHLLLKVARLEENRGLATSPSVLLSELRKARFLPDYKIANYISNKLEECGLVMSFMWDPDLKVPASSSGLEESSLGRQDDKGTTSQK